MKLLGWVLYASYLLLGVAWYTLRPLLYGLGILCTTTVGFVWFFTAVMLPEGHGYRYGELFWYGFFGVPLARVIGDLIFSHPVFKQRQS